MSSWLEAGKDFTHCEKGRCIKCSPAQRLECEVKANKAQLSTGKKGDQKP